MSQNKFKEKINRDIINISDIALSLPKIILTELGFVIVQFGKLKSLTRVCCELQISGKYIVRNNFKKKNYTTTEIFRRRTFLFILKKTQTVEKTQVSIFGNSLKYFGPLRDSKPWSFPSQATSTRIETGAKPWTNKESFPAVNKRFW